MAGLVKCGVKSSRSSEETQMIKQIEIHLSENICECDAIPDWNLVMVGDNPGIMLSCEQCGTEYFKYIREALIVIDEEEDPDDPEGEPIPEEMENFPDVKGNVVQLVQKVG